MKFVSYKETPGLERYAQYERFGIWRATHKRLLDEDAEYRRTRNRYRAAVICLTAASAGCGVLDPRSGNFWLLSWRLG